MKLTMYALSAVLSVGVSAFPAAAQTDWRNEEPNTVTLYSRTKHKQADGGYGKSAFSFKQGLRSDADIRATRNNFDVLYGNFDIGGDTDWFQVTMVTDDRSRIKDLGELDWASIFDVPILEAAAEPHKGIALDFKTKNFAESSDEQLARVSLGHIYVVHSRDSISDFYTLFRVDKLVPNDKVSISWKAVPSPEGPHSK